MIVYIDEIVYNVLDEFYDASMRKHPSLDYQTVIAKIDRLEKHCMISLIMPKCSMESPIEEIGARQDIINTMWKDLILRTVSMCYQPAKSCYIIMMLCMIP